MTVFLGRGSVVVENPSRQLMEGMRRFHHTRDGGEYEELFFMSQSGDVLSTLPGYAERVLKLCNGAKVVDKRMPMPDALLGAAVEGVHEVWHDVILKSIKAGGGVVAIPEMLGTPAFVSSIAKAYPRQGLADRGTPLTIVASRDRESARRTSLELRRLLPDRDVGIWSPGSMTDSEDIIVSTYGALGELPLSIAGIFIGDDLPGCDFVDRAEGVSGVRNAARWGVYTTSAGGCACLGMDLEGLFGPVVADATYKDAIDAGVGVPITVCWIDAPRPNAQWGSAPFAVLEGIAMQKNKQFVDMVADIVKGVPNDVGCIVCTEQMDMIHGLSEILHNVVEVHRKVPVKERRALLDDIAGGTIRKAIVTSGCWPLSASHGVMVVVTCGVGDVSGWRIPWRHLKSQGERAFIVDFRHGWDMNNGRSGRLALNDEARMRRYRELGFNQMSVSCVRELPFIGC